MADTLAITLHDVRYGYAECRVLDGISLSLATPEIFCILGANGAGKSTPTKIISSR